jgi:hypothetical protein
MNVVSDIVLLSSPQSISSRVRDVTISTNDHSLEFKNIIAIQSILSYE